MNEDTKYEGEPEEGAHVFGSKDQLPAPKEDVHVYYRPTENCVCDEHVIYENAEVDHPMSKDFVFVMRGRKVIGAINADTVVRVDIVPHVDRKPSRPVPTKGHPMQA